MNMYYRCKINIKPTGLMVVRKMLSQCFSTDDQLSLVRTLEELSNKNKVKSDFSKVR